MKFIEGFLILKFKRGSKKGQEYIKNTKRYIWIVPDYLLNDIELGDEVLVNSTRYDNKNKKYKICEWCEGIAIRNLKDENDIRYIYGLNIETSLQVSALNGNLYNIDELFIILTKMFDDNATNCVPYIS